MQKKRIELLLVDLKDWIVSYLVVLIIPIVICSAFFLYTYLMIWEETNNSNTIALQIVASDLDDIFERTFSVEYAIQRSDKIQNCVQYELPLNAEKRSGLLHASQALGECMGIEASVISALYLIYPESELVLMTGKTYTDLQGSYERIGEKFGYTSEEWRSLVKQRNNRLFIVNSETGFVSYISSLPLYGKKVKMNLVLELNTIYVQKILSKLDNMENSSILLVDEENHILLSRNLENINMTELPEKIQQAEGYKRITLDGKDMMVACINLERTNLKLISMIPYTEFWSKALESLSYFWIILALCICIGLGTSYILSVQKHKIWGRLNSMAKSRLEGSKSNKILRNKEIAEAVEGIVAEYDAMQSQLSSVESMKKELLLVSVLKGRIRPKEVGYVLEKNGVDFKIGTYALVLFKFNGFEPFFDAEEQKRRGEDIRFIKQTIASIVQELSQREFLCEIVNVDEKIACIIDFEGLDKEVCCEQITMLAQSIRVITKERLHEPLIISISDVHKHVFSLQNAYGEALRVMEYQMSMGNDLVMNYMEMVDETQMDYLYSLEDEKVLINLIYEGKEKEALQLLEEIYEKNILSIQGSEELSRCLMWNLTASVLRAENELRDKITLLDTRGFLESIKAENSVNEILQLLTRRISEISSGVSEIPVKGKKDILSEQVKEYILEHYADMNLGGSEIANQFEVNNAYLSKIFKEKNGMSLLSYIHMVRLDKAKQLLVTTNLNVEEIGGRVGYNNKVSFIRLFKKFEGITPTEYRNKRK